MVSPDDMQCTIKSCSTRGRCNLSYVHALGAHGGMPILTPVHALSMVGVRSGARVQRGVYAAGPPGGGVLDRPTIGLPGFDLGCAAPQQLHCALAAVQHVHPCCCLAQGTAEMALLLPA